MTAPRLVIDPALFAAGAVSEETRTFNAALRERMQGPGIEEIGIEAVRSGRLIPKAPRLDRAIDRMIPGPDGSPLGIRVVVPEDPVGAYLHLHMGGLVFGGADEQDERLAQIADRTGLAAVSVEYRLAPEHPWPAAWDDAEAAASWLAENVRSEFGGDRLAIGGESAGATLAVPTLVRMRDRHGFTGFHAAALTYGNYDTTGSPSNRRNGGDGMIIREADIGFCTRCYAPDPATRRDPDMSAIHAELHDLPPALFTVGTLDCFLDDSLFMAARWAAAGNHAELAVWPGAVHGFTAFPYSLAEEANGRIDAFLKRQVGLNPRRGPEATC
ncbi:MAG: alpha/beta hydrolase fold domain-containing protein [Allosphingosinicella sp.]